MAFRLRCLLGGAGRCRHVSGVVRALPVFERECAFPGQNVTLSSHARDNVFVSSTTVAVRSRHAASASFSTTSRSGPALAEQGEGREEYTDSLPLKLGGKEYLLNLVHTEDVSALKIAAKTVPPDLCSSALGRGRELSRSECQARLAALLYLAHARKPFSNVYRMHQFCTADERCDLAFGMALVCTKARAMHVRGRLIDSMAEYIIDCERDLDVRALVSRFHAQANALLIPRNWQAMLQTSLFDAVMLFHVHKENAERALWALERLSTTVKHPRLAADIKTVQRALQAQRGGGEEGGVHGVEGRVGVGEGGGGGGLGGGTGLGEVAPLSQAVSPLFMDRLWRIVVDEQGIPDPEALTEFLWESLAANKSNGLRELLYHFPQRYTPTAWSYFCNSFMQRYDPVEHGGCVTGITQILDGPRSFRPNAVRFWARVVDALARSGDLAHVEELITKMLRQYRGSQAEPNHAFFRAKMQANMAVYLKHAFASGHSDRAYRFLLELWGDDSLMTNLRHTLEHTHTHTQTRTHRHTYTEDGHWASGDIDSRRHDRRVRGQDASGELSEEGRSRGEGGQSETPQSSGAGSVITWWCVRPYLRTYLKEKRPNEFPTQVELLQAMARGRVRGAEQAYSYVLKGLCDRDQIVQAVELVTKMDESGLQRDPHIYSILMSYFADRGDTGKIERLMEAMRESKTLPDVVNLTNLMDAYARTGSMDSAMELLRLMWGSDHDARKPDVVVYTIMILACCRIAEISSQVHAEREEAEVAARRLREDEDAVEKGGGVEQQQQQQHEEEEQEEGQEEEQGQGSRAQQHDPCHLPASASLGIRPPPHDTQDSLQGGDNNSGAGSRERAQDTGERALATGHQLVLALQEAGVRLDRAAYLALFNLNLRSCDYLGAWMVAGKLRECGVQLNTRAYSIILQLAAESGDVAVVRQVMDEMETVRKGPDGRAVQAVMQMRPAEAPPVASKYQSASSRAAAAAAAAAAASTSAGSAAEQEGQHCKTSLSASILKLLRLQTEKYEGSSLPPSAGER